ncbi:MAG: tRNA (cytosine(32)/uridine(32)-2'-O)-methyltransferase TrmJ [Beggiatoa sp. IS2]|nr:MAG: tRNA (cytosine(32)/uridine(32)-2'-O)-methyltransferase TrmJ [Beggiatoa sp. IS2]
MLSNIHVVLVGITHPGNIGAAARAMKTMGLSRLILVQPKTFPCAEATARAAGADDILAQARICETLEEGLNDCRLVFGTSARPRTIAWPLLSPNAGAKMIVTLGEKTALLFGREHAGLTNQELELCHYVIQIPTNPNFSSLNVAAAVQILAYEIFTNQSALTTKIETASSEHCPAPAEAMTLFYQHLEQTLIDIQFLDPEKPRKLMRRLHRLFNRAQPDDLELNILRGILRAAQAKQFKS